MVLESFCDGQAGADIARIDDAPQCYKGLPAWATSSALLGAANRRRSRGRAIARIG